MPNIGLPEIAMVLIIALVVFGPKRLPEMGRQLGRTLREFKEATSDIRSQIGLDDIADSVSDIKSGLSLTSDGSRHTAETVAGAAAGAAVADRQPPPRRSPRRAGCGGRRSAVRRPRFRRSESTRRLPWSTTPPIRRATPAAPTAAEMVPDEAVDDERRPDSPTSRSTRVAPPPPTSRSTQTSPRSPTTRSTRPCRRSPTTRSAGERSRRRGRRKRLAGRRRRSRRRPAHGRRLRRRRDRRGRGVRQPHAQVRCSGGPHGRRLTAAWSNSTNASA